MHMFLLVAGEGKIPTLLEPFADYGGEGTNENGKFDWFEIGGRFGSALPLKEPRQIRRFFGLVPGFTTIKVVSAKKSEVDQMAFLQKLPAALLFRGQWYESENSDSEDTAQRWRTEFVRLFEEIPDDTTLTVVDCHG